MRTKHLSLPAKLNIGILAVFWCSPACSSFSAITCTAGPVYDPYVRKLEDPAQMYLQEIPSCLESLLQYVGTEELVTRVHAELEAFEDGTPQFDDITMLCLRYNGAGRLVILNGPSSAGKSSIAAELQQQLAAVGKDPVLLSIDDYMKIGTDEEIWEDDVFEIMPDMCRDLTAVLKEGRWVVVDHVVTSERIWQALLDAAEGCPVTSVQVTCSLETLKKREKERGNRFPGSAEASFRYLYPKEGYDLQINSEESTPQTSAETIKNYLLGNSQA